MEKQQTGLSERGQSLTELALSMTVLLILLAGVFDLGRAFFTFMALRDAVQEGALYGSINPTMAVEIKEHVRSSSDLVQNLIAGDDITVQLIGPACHGSGIRVSVIYNNFTVTMPFLGSILGTQTFPIRASVTDTILSPACP